MIAAKLYYEKEIFQRPIFAEKKENSSNLHRALNFHRCETQCSLILSAGPASTANEAKTPHSTRSRHAPRSECRVTKR